MKKIIKLLAIFFTIILSKPSEAQNMQIVSDLSWGVDMQQNGNFNMPAYDIGACVDEAAIDNACTTSYASPHLDEHFETCPDMVPIWGRPVPEECKSSAETFWFQKTFNLDLECNQLTNARALVQADNAFTFFLNGEEIGSSFTSEWQSVKSYDVLNDLVSGENTITIRVNNTSGGSCYNYAFLAFCLDIFTNEINYPDASFYYEEDPTDSYTINFNAYEEDYPQYEWTLNGSVISTQNNFRTAPNRSCALVHEYRRK